MAVAVSVAPASRATSWARQRNTVSMPVFRALLMPLASLAPAARAARLALHPRGFATVEGWAPVEI